MVIEVFSGILCMNNTCILLAGLQLCTILKNKNKNKKALYKVKLFQVFDCYRKKEKKKEKRNKKKRKRNPYI